MITNFVKQFCSYEGEGPNVGVKTMFLTYDRNLGTYADFSYIDDDSIKAIYINTEFIDYHLYEFLSNLINNEKKLTITVEIPLKNFLFQDTRFFKDNLSEHILFFFRANENELLKDWECSIVEEYNDFNSLIKIEIPNTEVFSERVELANEYGKLGLTTYLMPLFSYQSGEEMLKHFEKLHYNVRLMPPTQFLINID